MKNINNKNKKQSKAKSATFYTFLGLICACALTAAIVVGYVLVSVVSFANGDVAIDLEDYKENQNQTSFIYARADEADENSWVQIASLHGTENRVWVDLDDMSPYLSQAFIALEDQRFVEHGGVDWIRTIGVIVKPSNFGQGGSTITQQLIKNITKKKEVTTVRKFNEILSALNLENHYDKDTIIEAYLNTLYLGSGCYGVKTASETYFGKDVSELNLAECAVIASITQAPTKYNPLLNPENNRKRQLVCLEHMLTQEKITQAEYDEAVAYELIFTNSENYVPQKDESKEEKPQVVETEIQSYYVDYVIETVIQDLMAEYGYTRSQASDEIHYGGLKIYAAVDLKAQENIESVFVKRETMPKENATKEKPAAQAAMTVMDYNGRVVAICGGVGEKTKNRSLNRAAFSYRQPGSSIKPLATYAPALEANLITWSTHVLDSAIWVNGKRWPHNSGGSYGSGKNVTVQNAIARSLNTVPARIINYTLGIDNSFDYLKNKFHISTLNETSDRLLAPLATGAFTTGVSTVEMAAAYAAIGNGGTYYKPYCYYKVTNSKGTEIILSNNDDGQKALSKDTAQVLCKLLQSVSSSSYGKDSNLAKFEFMCKTGTTSDNKDRWFCAGTPYYVSAVWYGYDQPRPITNLNSSANPAGRLCVAVFNKLHKGLDSDLKFKTDAGIIKKAYCVNTGLIASSNCPKATGWYKQSHLPSVCTGGCGSSASTDSGTSSTTSGGGNDTTVTTTQSIENIADNFSQALDNIIN